MVKTDASHARTVRIRVVIAPAKPPPPRAKQLTARVEDTSRADAAAVIVAEERVSNPGLVKGEPFTLDIDVPEEVIKERSRYTARVHVDVSGSGDISRGDYLSTRSYPVLTAGFPDDVTIEVEPV